MAVKKIQYIQSTKVREKLRGNGFQIKAECFLTIDSVVNKLLEKLIEGAQSDNIKSIGTDDVLWILGIKETIRVVDDPNGKTPVMRTCSRCGGIEQRYLSHARNVQALVSDEAQRLLVRNQ